MKSEREKLQARKLTFATAEAFTQRDREKETQKGIRR
jgi:hypothetical protein